MPDECVHGVPGEETCEACLVEASFDHEYTYSWEDQRDEFDQDDPGSSAIPTEREYIAMIERQVWEARSRERAREINQTLQATVHVLTRHGLPLRYEVIGEMVRDAEGVQATDDQVLGVLRHFKDRFQAVSPGVYRLKESS